KRDMYGNDAYFNGALTGHPTTGAAMAITGVALITAVNQITVKEVNGLPKLVNTAGLYKCLTNIPGNLNTGGPDPAFYPYNFTRWIMRFAGGANGVTYNVAQTHEVLIDDPDDASGFRAFYIAPWDEAYNSQPYFQGVSGGTPPTLPATMIDPQR